MRLFAAVYAPAGVLDDLCAVVDKLAIGRAAADGVNVRLARRDRLHVTVVFLGEVLDTRRAGVDAAIGASITRWAAAKSAAAQVGSAAARGGSAAAQGGSAAPVLRLGGGGRFGRGRFTVLWTGLRGDVAALRDLAAAAQRELKRARLPFDDRPFKPHLTVARPGDRLPREELAGDLAALREYEGPEWTVDELCLVRSYPGPDPRYERLATWPLGPA